MIASAVIIYTVQKIELTLQSLPLAILTSRPRMNALFECRIVVNLVLSCRDVLQRMDIFPGDIVKIPGWGWYPQTPGPPPSLHSKERANGVSFEEDEAIVSSPERMCP